MKALSGIIFLIPLLPILVSCHTLNTAQSSYVKKFAGTAQEVSDLPYRIMYDYYSIKFKRKQLLPENYVTGDTAKSELDEAAENVILRIEGIKKDYNDNLQTANEIKIVYDLLQTYLKSLEKLASDKYSKDFEKKSSEMGNKMNSLVTNLNASPGTKVGLSLNPGEWLSSIATLYGRTKLKTKQVKLLREYISRADTLVQAINLNFLEIEVPIMNSWFEEEKKAIRDQFKRSIAPYLQNINRHPDSATSIAAIEFFSKINPVYYELTDGIYKDQLLIQQTSTMMKSLAQTHHSMNSMFDSKNNWLSIAEEVDELKEKLFVLKDLFNKEDQEKFSFYKNFILENENSFKNIFTK
jgi:hypothetical protein